jgi:hypothetical protein
MMAGHQLPWNHGQPMGYAAYPGYGTGYGYGAPGYPQQGYGWPAQGMMGGSGHPMYQPVGYTPGPGVQGWAAPAYWYNSGSR